MSPSIYLGCQVEDEIDTSYKEVRKTFSEYKSQTEALLATLADDIEKLSSDKIPAEITVGETTNSQVRWVAKETGTAGNDIQIMYQYLGPGALTGAIFADRPPSAEVVDNIIYVTLAVKGGDTTAPPDPQIGQIDPNFDVATSLPIWLSGTGVSDLVTAALVGAGTDLPATTLLQSFSGGKGAPLKDAEDAANSIAKVFGSTTYAGFMRSLSIPTIETEADAVALLEELDDNYVIINKKLYIVEGTNLVGLRQLYLSVQKDLDLFKYTLDKMNEDPRFAYYIATENVFTTTQELVCGTLQPITTMSETYLGQNMPISQMLQKSQGNDITFLNNSIYWVTDVNASRYSYTKLTSWEWIGNYLGAILAGETPDQSDGTEVQAPIVSVIEDPNLFQNFGFTDAEIVEVLEKDIEGIRIPQESDPEDKNEGIKDLLINNRRYMPNGMLSTAKKPLVAMQALDISSTGNENKLAKELSTRGSTCARLAKNLPDVVLPDLGGIKIPNVDSPDLPSADLPNGAKKIESAFASLSAMIDSASKLFDAQIGGILKVAKGLLNKVQNLLSLADNISKNNLAQCLLGTGSAATGNLELPSPGEIPTVPTPGEVELPSPGGLPLPTSLLTSALKELSVSLDETITASFEGLMKLVEYPLCMVQSLLSSLQGFSLDVDLADLNPCKEGKDVDEDCPPEEVQEAADSSETVTEELDEALADTGAGLAEDLADSVPDFDETIQEFTGQVEKTAKESTETAQRGISNVMDDVMKSLNSKVEFVQEIDKAIKELINDTEDSATNGEEAEEAAGGCKTPSLGALTDSITDFI